MLAELFYQYMNVEEEFIKALFTEGETQLGRVFVQEAALSVENSLHVLDYERASEVIKTASHRGDWDVLLSPQDDAPGSGLCRSHGHLHDLQ